MKALTLAATLVVAVSGWFSPAAAATTAATYQRDIFTVTNEQRADHGRVLFTHQSCVQRYAERQAARMAAQERIFHQDLRKVLRDCNLRSAGENVAFGFDTGRSVVEDGWMRSAGHRANILRAGFRLLGTGARRGDDGLWYAVQVFGSR